MTGDRRGVKVRDIAPALAAAPFGFLAFFGPTIVSRIRSGSPITLESLGQAQEGCGVLQLALLAGVGIGMGLLSVAHPVWIGFFTIVGLPVWSLLDAIEANRHGLERHSLLGIEWAFYLAYGAFPMVGALLAQKAIKRLGRKRGRAA